MILGWCVRWLKMIRLLAVGILGSAFYLICSAVLTLWGVV